jgi:hypothetical protein
MKGNSLKIAVNQENKDVIFKQSHHFFNFLTPRPGRFTATRLGGNDKLTFVNAFVTVFYPQRAFAQKR